MTDKELISLLRLAVKASERPNAVRLAELGRRSRKLIKKIDNGDNHDTRRRKQAGGLHEGQRYGNEHSVGIAEQNGEGETLQCALHFGER